jgi:hypothetical protein
MTPRRLSWGADADNRGLEVECGGSSVDRVMVSIEKIVMCIIICISKSEYKTIEYSKIMKELKSNA